MAKENASPPPRSKSPTPPKKPEHSRDMPVFSCRHRALKAAVWMNESENGPFYNVTVTRSYKEGEAWKESSSFGYDDILPIAELLRTCHSFISRERAKERASQADVKSKV